MANNSKKANNKYKMTPARIAACLVAAVLALLMLGSVLFGALFPAFAAVTEADLNKLKDKLATATAEKNALKKDLSALSSDKTKVKEQITLLDSQIAKAEDEIELQAELIDQLGQLIAGKTVELAESVQREEEQYEKARLRIRFMAEQGSLSYLSILLSADSFADFLARYEVVSQISTYDAQVFDSLKAIKETVAAQKLSLEEDMALEESTKADMEAAKIQLEKQLSDKNKAMQNILANEAETQAEYRKMIEAEENLMEQVKKTAAELAAQTSFVGADGWAWPLSSSHKTITCVYGMRNHPITGKYSLHTGVDIRAASGTKIYASNHGTVATSGYNAAYGNYVVINHGGGYTTLYAHMSKRAVSQGDKVKQGDVIGYVGSTGYSTGPHLHFEISKDGKTSNPLDKFSNVKFTFV